MNSHVYNMRMATPKLKSVLTEESCRSAEDLFRYATQFVGSKIKNNHCWGGIEKSDISFTDKGIEYYWESDMTGYGGSTEDHYETYSYEEFFKWMDKKK